MFFVQTNSTGVDYRYELTLNGTKFTGRIEAEAAKDSQFARWTVTKENAAAAFIPEGGSSDLQAEKPEGLR